MNPFNNPNNTIPFLKNYLIEPKRIEKKNKTQLQKYKNKAFKKLIAQAFKVPMYKNKYNEHKIKPQTTDMSMNINLTEFMKYIYHFHLLPSPEAGIGVILAAAAIPSSRVFTFTV